MNIASYNANIKNITDFLTANGYRQNNFQVESIDGGRNNRSYLVTAENKNYFLKHYFSDSSKTQSRLDVEYSFVRFAWEQGISCIAKPIMHDLNYSMALYEYISGRKLTKNEIGESEIQQVLDFIFALNQKKNSLPA